MVVVNRRVPASLVVRIALAEDQVSVARKNAHVVAVLVEGMLPASLADDSQQHQLAWMHMRIAVIGLMRVLRARSSGPCHPASSGR